MFTLKQSNRLGLKQWKFFRQFEWKQAVKSPGVHVLRPTLPADGVRQNSRVSMLLVSIPHLKALRNCDFGAPHVLHLILAAVAKRPTYAWGAAKSARTASFNGAYICCLFFSDYFFACVCVSPNPICAV